MSDLSTTHNREKWQRSLENLHNQQLEDKLGTVIEKARISGADKLEANFLPDSISNLRSGIDRSKQESEAKYGIILSAMEKSIPLYNDLVKNAPKKDEQIMALTKEKDELIKQLESVSSGVQNKGIISNEYLKNGTNLMIDLLKKVVPKSHNSIKEILDDSGTSDEEKFNTVLSQFENTISDTLELVMEKEEIISFSKFKINELNTKLSKIQAESGNKTDSGDKLADYKKQIEKLNQEIFSLKKQLSSGAQPYEQVQEEVPTLVIVENEDGKKIVKSGTAKDLVDRLLDPTAFDLGFIQTLFLCHHLFIDSVELLQTLIKHMQEGIKTRFEGGDHNVLRIGNVIKYWLDNHFEDFDSNDVLLGSIDGFLTENASIKGFNNILITLKKILEKKLTESSESLDEIPEKPPKAIIPKPVQTHVFLSFDPLEFARQLTVIEFELFEAIPVKELLDQYWRMGEENLAPNISEYEKWKTGLSSLLLSELSSYKDEKLRLQAFELMLSIGECLEQLNNYSSMYIFCLLYRSEQAAKIKKEKNHLKIIENVNNLFSPDENYKKLRDRLAQSKSPLIPPLEMYQGELIYLNSCSLVQRKEGIVQFHLLQLSAVAILEIKEYQKKSYTFTVVPIIRNYIKKTKAPAVIDEGKMLKGAFSMTKGLFLKQDTRSIIDLHAGENKLSKSASEAHISVDSKAQDQFYHQASEAIGDIKVKLHGKIQDLQQKLTTCETELSISKRQKEDQEKQFNEKQIQVEENFKKEKKEMVHIIKNLKKQIASRLLIPEGAILREEPKFMKFLVKQGKNTLMSSTVPFFVKYILDPQTGAYLSFAFGLFLHHRLFIQTDELLEAILMKWRDKNGEQGETAVDERERLASIIELWLRFFFSDFRDDPNLLSLISNYVNRESLISDSEKVRRITETIKEKLISPLEDAIKISPTIQMAAPYLPAANFKKNYKGVFVERSQSKFVLLDFEPEELARQMTIMDFMIFKQIEARELIDNNWIKTEKLFNAPNVCKLAQLANHFVTWIVSELVLVSDPVLRLKTMEHIISTAKHLESMNNFNGIRHILRALLNNATNFLVTTKNGLSPSSKTYLEELKNLLSADFGYASLRNRILVTSLPLMPLMPLYYSDLGFYESLGNLTSKDGEELWINAEKIVGIANTVQTLQKFQTSIYRFQPVNQIQEHILKYPCLLPKEAEDTAVRLEGMSTLKRIIGKKASVSSNEVNVPTTAKVPPKKEIPTIVEEDGLVFAIIGSNKNLKCGSLHGLLNYLIDVRMNDLGVIYAFLLHHMLFINSWNLLEILIEKWKEKAEENTDHGKAEVFRVANILKFWIDNFFMDIKKDTKNLEFITEFFDTQSLDLKANSLFVILGESVKQKLKADSQLKKIAVINPPKSFKPIAGFKSAQPNIFISGGKSPFVLLDFEALEVARQLTLLDFQYYQAIEPREYLDSNWRKKDKQTLSPNIGKFVIWSTCVTNWMISEILNVSDINARAQTIEKLISVASELIKIKNFNSIRAIVGAIFSPCITRLKKTFNLLPNKARETLKEITTLISDKEDYKVLREKMSTLSPPMIPYPELYYSDLESHNKYGDLVNHRNDEKWINVEKMVAVSFVIKGILNYQKSRYHFETIKDIQDHIQDYPKLSGKAAEEASLKLEP